MSKKKRPQGRRATPSRRKSQGSPSLAIPIVVGLVVLVIIAGVLVFLEGRQTSAVTTEARATALPLPTRVPPFPDVARISPQETKGLMDKGDAILVDVRSRAAYEASHAVAALSIPEEEIDGRLDELPRDKALVLYCT